MLLGFALLAAGCGSDDDDGATGATTETTAGSEEATGDAAEEAAAELGIDLDDCDESFTEPIEGDIVAGHHNAMTGPASAFSLLVPGIQAYVEKVNAEGGIDGHNIELVIGDDQYNPQNTVRVVNEFIDRDQIDLIMAAVGSPTNLAASEVIQRACIPSVGASAGSPLIFRGEDHPFTVSAFPAFEGEVKSWLEDVTTQHPDGAKIGLFWARNETGQAYKEALDKHIGDTPHELVGEQTIEVGDTAAPTSQVTTLAASGANVAFLHNVGPGCPAVLQQMNNAGWEPDQTYITSTCAQDTVLGAAGPLADGVRATMYTQDPTNPEFEGTPEMAEYVDALRAMAPDADPEDAILGWVLAQVSIDALQAAAESELGLSRLGILHAARTQELEPDLLLPGIPVRYDGLEDTVGIESYYIGIWNSELEILEPQELYSFEGELTPN